MASSDNSSAIATDRTLIDRLKADGFANDLLGAVDLRLKRKRRLRRAVSKAVAASVVFIAAAFWAVPYFRNTATLITPPAERRSLELADGSRVELNAQTDLKTDFRYGRRQVRLERGEIFLSVAKDAEHPFIVETPSGSIRVTGTEFNVRIGADHRADVTLIEGTVLIKSGSGAEQPMTPGHAAIFQGNESVVRPLSAAELDNATAWRRGSIILDGITLGEAVERFATFHGKKIEVNPSAASIQLGGTYSLDNLPQFFEALKATHAVRIVPGDQDSYLIVPLDR